jgi:small subunit ribosomal protein S24e
LDPLSYLLFGAYDIRVTERGLECDDWLPIVGNIDALDDIQRLKYLMEACMLRVFEGITFARHRHSARGGPIPAPREEPENESDDDDDAPIKDYSLSSTEIRELDNFTHDIVRILDRFSEERALNQSRHNSRPATPMGSPSFGMSRLPSYGSRSGTSTPYGTLSAYNSRPGTPGPGPSPLRRT